MILECKYFTNKYKHDCVLKDAEPSVTIECNPNEGWEEDVKDSELTRAFRRVVDSTLDKNVHAKVEPKEVGYSLIFHFTKISLAKKTVC